MQVQKIELTGLGFGGDFNSEESYKSLLSNIQFCGGDVKLMACAGLAIGWQNITLAFFLGCIIGSVIHLIRMKITKAGSTLAMGPYLAAGIFISMLWGEKMISAYLALAGF